MASAEMVSLGVRALNQAGISGLTVDIGIPHLFDVITQTCDADTIEALSEAVALRDVDQLLAMSDKQAALLAKLLQASGQSRDALADLLPELSGEAVEMVELVLHVQSMVNEIWPDLPITFDLLDRRDGDYHKGLNFAIFATGLRGEIARGEPIRQDMAKRQRAYQFIWNVCYGPCLMRRRAPRYMLRQALVSKQPWHSPTEAVM